MDQSVDPVLKGGGVGGGGGSRNGGQCFGRQ